MIGTGCPLILAFPPGHEYAGATDHGHAEDREAVGDIAPKYEAPNGRENNIGVIEGREPTGYLDDDTVRSWLKRYRAGGLDEMTLFDWHGRLSRTRFPWTQNWLNRSVQGGPEHDR